MSEVRINGALRIGQRRLLALSLTISAAVVMGGVADSYSQSALPDEAAAPSRPDSTSSGGTSAGGNIADPTRADGEGSRKSPLGEDGTVLPLPAGDDAVSDDAVREVAATKRAGAAAASDPVPWSEGTSEADRLAAREAFLSANKLARRRFFASAMAKYRQALDLWPHPAFAYNLALAQLQLDQPIEAHASLQRAIAHGPEPLGDRYQEARQQIARIESEAGQLVVTCGEVGARVMVDGQLLFVAPGTGRRLVRPGAYQVVAIRSGLTPVIETVVLTPGDESSVALTFTYPEVEITVSERRWAAWKSYTVLATGAALLAAGVTLDWQSSRRFNDHDRAFRRACAQGCTDPDMTMEFDGERSRAEREQELATVGYAAGGAVLATGAILAYLGRERISRKRIRQAPEGPDNHDNVVDDADGPASIAAGRGEVPIADAIAPRVRSPYVVPWIGAGGVGLNAEIHF